MCQTEESHSQGRETLLPRRKIGLSATEGQEEGAKSSEVKNWVHVFSRPGIFETTQLPLPTIYTFRRTSDWLNLILLIYKIFG